MKTKARLLLPTGLFIAGIIAAGYMQGYRPRFDPERVGLMRVDTNTYCSFGFEFSYGRMLTRNPDGSTEWDNVWHFPTWVHVHLDKKALRESKH